VVEPELDRTSRPARGPAVSIVGSVSLFGVLAVWSWAAAQGVSAPPLGPAPQAELIELRNGLNLLLAPDPEATAVDVSVWYDSGTRHERGEQSGIAHLFEHLMFRGSARVGAQDHQHRIEAVGGASGAVTTADYTCFFQTLPPDSLELAFRLEADRMASLRLTQEALDAERAQVRIERTRRFEGTPLGRGIERLYATVFRVHPYRGSVLGSDEELARLTLKQVRDWYAARYAPNRALVTVAGRFDVARAKELARKWFEPVRRTGTAVSPPPEPRQTAERRVTQRGTSPLPLLLLGWRGPGRSDPDASALQVLAYLLGRGESSRIARALAATGGALLVQGELDARKDASLFYVTTVPGPESDSAAVERAVTEAIAQVARERVAPEEFERARNSSEAALLFSWHGARGRAQAIGAATMLTGNYTDAARQLERLRTLTAADLQRVAARWLTPGQRNVVWMTAAASGSRTAEGRP
jgi:zinc protease